MVAATTQKQFHRWTHKERERENEGEKVRERERERWSKCDRVIKIQRSPVSKLKLQNQVFTKEEDKTKLQA